MPAIRGKKLRSNAALCATTGAPTQSACSNIVVIELKVSRGYESVVGQLLRYMAWVERHLVVAGQSVRGIIIAKSISEDLLLACSRVNGVGLFEYNLAVTLRPIDVAAGVASAS